MFFISKCLHFRLIFSITGPIANIDAGTVSRGLQNAQYLIFYILSAACAQISSVLSTHQSGNEIF